MKHTLISIITAATITLGACTSAVNAEAELQNAEMAVARGDMTAAGSVAKHLSDDKNLSGLSATQIARLSIIYMQIADSADIDANVATAANLYRKAYAANRDSAEAFYTALPSEMVQYSMILSNIVETQDHPLDIDSCMHADSIFDYSTPDNHQHQH